MVQRLCYFKIKKEKIMERIYTGYENLDEQLWIYKGNLVVIGGRPAVGKTSFMCSILENNAKKYKSIFFSMEEKRSKRIEDVFGRTLDYKDNVIVVRRIVDYEELLTCVAENKVKMKIDVVYINNLFDLIICSKRSEGEIISRLKDMATRLEVAVIVADTLMQFDRRILNYKDLIHKELIKYADKILLIDRPDKTATEKQLKRGLVKKNVAQIWVNKDVDASYNEIVEFWFNHTSFRFIEIPKMP